jgi:hypothetical protein
MAELEAELTSSSLPEAKVETSTPTTPVTEAPAAEKREADKKKLDEMRRQIEEGLRS